MYWRIIETVLPKTCGGEELPAYFWRDSENYSEWKDGKPPIGAGVYCNKEFKPLREFELDELKDIHISRIEYSKMKSKSYWKKFG